MESLSELIAFALDPLQTFLGLQRDLENVNSAQMALRAVLIYSLALVLVRIGSKRFLSQASAFDVIVAIMLGSIMSRAINGSAPFAPTVVAAGAVVLLHAMLAAVAAHSPSFGPLVKGEPRLLIKTGRVLDDEMQRAKLTHGDLMQALRTHAQHQDPSLIESAYLERNGSISIIPFRKALRVLDVTVENGVKTVRIEVS